MTELTLRKPFAALTPLMDDLMRMPMSDIFERAFPTMLSEGDGQRWSPKVDLAELADSYVIKAELPGCKIEDISVTLHGDRITLQGEKQTEKRQKDENMHVWERSYGAFARSFTFPSAVDENSVEAVAQDGVLTVTVKKNEKERTRKIEIKSK